MPSLVTLRRKAVEPLTGEMTADLADPRYPRRGPVRILRTLLLFSWSIILGYFTRAGWNFYQIVRTNNAVLNNPAALASALLLPGPLADSRNSGWVYPVLGLSFFLLIYGCFWALRDADRERKVAQKREVREIVTRTLPFLKEQLQTALREIGLGADRAADPPQGPPDDAALLPAPEHFVGRAADLEWLLERLRIRGSIAALGGLGGIGKTTLVAVAVRRLRAEGRFPDGVAVILCQGLSDPIETLRRTLARFDPQRRQPAASDAAGLAEAARRLLADKDALIVLDNVEPALPVAQVIAPLRAVGATLVLTARHALSHEAVPVEAARTLDLLSQEEALDVFAQALGRTTAQHLSAEERIAAERIVSVLGRHTLAIKLAGAYAADLHRDLGALAHELENPQRAIALPRGETPEAVALVFAESTEALPPEARRLFAALGVFATPQFGRAAALALGQALALTEPETTLNLLVLRALVVAYTSDLIPEGGDRERLRLHPLLRALAGAELARWPEGDRDAAYGALARYYATYANETGDTTLPPDEANITGALEWAHDHGHDELVAALCAGMQYFWRDRWRTDDSLRYLPWGIAAAERRARATGQRGDRLRAADLALFYGQVLRRTGQLDEAERTFQANLAIRREAQDAPGEGAALAQLGNLALRRGRLEEAERYTTQALALFRAAGDPQSEADALTDLGQVAQRRGRDAEAERAYQQALALFQAARDRQGEGWVLNVLARLDAARGRLEEAARTFQQALAIGRELQDRQGEGLALIGLAQLAEAQGQLDDAEREYRVGLAILDEVRDAFNYAGRAQDFAAFLIQRRGTREEGCALFAQAARLYARMGLPEDEAAARERAKRLGCG
ncbi:MAG: tetratricopeptide repeat protein [Ktedonobacterales bacterium]|nr:tetratricopeptide repeat protein [Ktedonobacterales bacterium]